MHRATFRSLTLVMITAIVGLQAAPASDQVAAHVRDVTPRVAPTSATTVMGGAVLTVAPASTTPGATVVVSATGFQADEVVVIAIDTLPITDVATTAQGAVAPVDVPIPLTARPGAHRIMLSGGGSGLTVAVSLRVTPLQPRVTLSGTTFDPTRTACLLGQGFGSREEIRVAVNDTTIITGIADITGGFDLCYGTPSAIGPDDNIVTVTGLTSGAQAIAHFTGVLPLGHRLYIAGSGTADGDRSRLYLFNPNAFSTHAEITLLFTHAAPQQRLVPVGVHRTLIVDLNALAGDQPVLGVQLRSDRIILAHLTVERPTGALYSPPTVSGTARSWYLADGYTEQSFHEKVVVLNPGTQSTRVRVSMVGVGDTAPSTVLSIPAQRLATLDVNTLWPGQSFTLALASTQPIVVVRLRTFGPHSASAAVDGGTSTGQRRWTFAANSVQGSHQTYLSVYNPGRYYPLLHYRPLATLTTRVYDATGRLVVTRYDRVGAQQRLTVPLQHLLGGNATFSLQMSSTRPLVVERTLYTGDPTAQRTASITGYGTQKAATTWLFAAGDPTSAVQTIMSIVAPSYQGLVGRATLYLADGTTIVRTFITPPHGEIDFNATAQIVGARAPLLAVQLEALNNVAFVAEQDTYTTTLTGGYSTLGVQTTVVSPQFDAA